MRMTPTFGVSAQSTAMEGISTTASEDCLGERLERSPKRRRAGTRCCVDGKESLIGKTARSDEGEGQHIPDVPRTPPHRPRLASAFEFMKDGMGARPPDGLRHACYSEDEKQLPGAFFQSGAGGKPLCVWRWRESKNVHDLCEASTV